MNSFTIYTPTRIFFGADQMRAFSAATAALGWRALVMTGGSSVKRLGILDEVTTVLTEAGLQLSFFDGVEPNPEAATVNRAAAKLRAEKSDFVVAVGGGSVIDAAKAAAALAHADQPDIWPFVFGEKQAGKLKGALPVVAVPTTAATASEVTPFAVVSHRAVQGKSMLAAEFLKPRVAWLNPRYTLSLSATTTQDGAADILSHMFESYLLGGSESPLADRHSEGVMATVLEVLPRLLQNPADEAARGTMQWAATLAFNDYQCAGRRSAHFILHYMEHALSGRRATLTHGRGLAAIYPAYFRWLLRQGRAVERLAQLGARLFGITGDSRAQAEGFVRRFEQWLSANGLSQSLHELGFTDDDFPAVADYAVRVYGDGRQLDALGAMIPADIVGIFKDTRRSA